MAYLTIQTNSTNDQKRAIVAFADYDFDGTTSQTDFVVGQAINSTQTLDVWVSGRLQREGALENYTRNTGASKVVLTTGLTGATWVRVRVHNN